MNTPRYEGSRGTGWLQQVFRPVRPAEMTAEERVEYTQFLSRVRYFVLIKGIVNALTLILYLFTVLPDWPATVLVALIDGLLLIPYVFAVRRWPVLSTTVLLLLTALAISAADAVSGYQTATSGVLYAVLIVAGAVLLFHSRNIALVTVVITATYLLTFLLETPNIFGPSAVIPVQMTLQSPRAIVRVVSLHTLAFLGAGAASWFLTRLYRQLLETRIQSGFLAALLAGFQEISGDLQLHTLLQRIAERAVSTIPTADRGIVVVREDDRLVIRAVAGYGALPLGGLSFPMETLGLPVESLPAQIADFAERSQKYLPPEVSAFLHTLPQTQATLFLPLQGKETFHGLLAVSSTQRPDAFDADGRQILDLFAHQAAIAIENARLFSELQSSLEEVQRQARELTRGQEELQGLIAAVSQRIQGPVEALAGFARLLKDGAAARLTDEESDYLDRIERNSRYMSRLTQDMLFLSRLDQVGEEREPITLTTLVRGVGTHLELERQKITLSVQEGMPVVYADPVLTWTLFRNLLQNARRLLGEAEDPRIEVSCQVEDGTYHLSVRGNGEALSPEGLERIFDLFAPLGKSGADGPEIGLTVARRILQRYNGRAWAAAEAGRGTSFHVAFPIELGQQ